MPTSHTHIFVWPDVVADRRFKITVFHVVAKPAIAGVEQDRIQVSKGTLIFHGSQTHALAIARTHWCQVFSHLRT
jgi:lactam utilization protein B